MAQVTKEKGYVGMTVEDVCRIAGVSSRSFYQHYADKEEAFLAMYDQVIAALTAHVAEAYRRPGPWRGRVREGLEVLLNLIAAEPALARLCLVDILAAGEKGRAHWSKFLASFVPFFDDAELGGGLPRPSPVVVHALIGGVAQILYERVAADRTQEVPDLAPDLAYYVLLPFLGPDEAAEELSKGRSG